MKLERSIEIAQPIDAVFEFVADARNDPAWCTKVRSVEQVEGDGPGPGARYRVVHRPIPLRPPRELDMTCLAWEPPQRIEWREDDGVDVFEVTYELVATAAGTRMTQCSAFTLGAPVPAHPILRWGIGRDVAKQLRALKRELER